MLKLDDAFHGVLTKPVLTLFIHDEIVYEVKREVTRAITKKINRSNTD